MLFFEEKFNPPKRAIYFSHKLGDVNILATWALNEERRDPVHVLLIFILVGSWPCGDRDNSGFVWTIWRGGGCWRHSFMKFTPWRKSSSISSEEDKMLFFFPLGFVCKPSCMKKRSLTPWSLRNNQRRLNLENVSWRGGRISRLRSLSMFGMHKTDVLSSEVCPTGDFGDAVKGELLRYKESHDQILEYDWLHEGGNVSEIMEQQPRKIDSDMGMKKSNQKTSLMRNIIVTACLQKNVSHHYARNDPSVTVKVTHLLR